MPLTRNKRKGKIRTRKIKRNYRKLYRKGGRRKKKKNTKTKKEIGGGEGVLLKLWRRLRPRPPPYNNKLTKEQGKALLNEIALRDQNWDNQFKQSSNEKEEEEVEQPPSDICIICLGPLNDLKRSTTDLGCVNKCKFHTNCIKFLCKANGGVIKEKKCPLCQTSISKNYRCPSFAFRLTKEEQVQYDMWIERQRLLSTMP